MFSSSKMLQIASIIAALAMMYFMVFVKSKPEMIALDRDFMRYEAMVKVAESGQSIEGFFEGTSKPRVSISAQTFDCLDQATRLAKYQQASMHAVASNETITVGSGCMKMQTVGSVVSLKGAGYFLSVPTETPNQYYQCGTGYGGRNDSEATCRMFLRQHAGREVYVFVRSGGFLTIN